LLIFSDGVFEIWRDKHAAWDWPACVSYLTTLSHGAETVLDELIEHVRFLRGSHQLDDDFSIIETRFDHDTSKKAQYERLLTTALRRLIRRSLCRLASSPRVNTETPAMLYEVLAAIAPQALCTVAGCE